jgi:hypothetical protein
MTTRDVDGDAEVPPDEPPAMHAALASVASTIVDDFRIGGKIVARCLAWWIGLFFPHDDPSELTRFAR